jgi:hypothetical protein
MVHSNIADSNVAVYQFIIFTSHLPVLIEESTLTSPRCQKETVWISDQIDSLMHQVE